MRADLPRDVDAATKNPGLSWPHVLADALRGGAPFRPLPLPTAPSTAWTPPPVVVVLASTLLYVLAAWLL